ncbi:MAG: RagB/SusD family nutrient uptake outer membrane protein [Bacteroidales bacterium]|nr:RagB/SusD family nutrient uptake outer membrane protein [Bacteroidales bacterium]
MKNIILKAALAVLAGLLTCSCAKEYLDTLPEDATSPGTIFETTTNAKLAINGLSRLMTKQYMSNQGYNGEGTIMSHYGNWPGNDLQRVNNTGNDYIINHEAHDQVSYYVDIFAWFYYYKLINNANQIIHNIDNAEGSESERQFIRAQARVFRAYSYFMLSQIYCYRWDDRNSAVNEGVGYGLPLRLDDSTGPLEKTSLEDIYKFIYEDLDAAIADFKASGLKRASDEFYLPDIDVACAVYARAALTRQDWGKAAEMARQARQGHALMSANDYMESGFSVPNNEWIWGVYDASDQTLYYYSYFAYLASNGSSGNCRNYPSAISQELYEQIPETDVRRGLWIEPTDAERKECNSAGISTKTLSKRAFAEHGDKLFSTSKIAMYMQIKFQNQDQPGVGSFNFFRAAEMYLTEAEALCMQGGHDNEVQKLLNEVNKNLDPAYSCDKTGANLLNEVKLYRRLDLWGEGQNWFDFKRWNQPIVRKSISDGGSWHMTFAKTIAPEDNYKWTFFIPQKELDYNNLVRN